MSTVHVQILMIAEATSEHHRPGRSLLWYNSTVQNLLDAGGGQELTQIDTDTSKIPYTHSPPCYPRSR